MKEAKTLGSDVTIPKLEEVPLGKDDSNFIVHCPNQAGFLGVLEDDGDVGWFYLFDPSRQEIVRSAHIYNVRGVSVAADDVDIVWSLDNDICGVAIWAEMRAFLGLSNGIEMRERVYDRETRGFNVSDWPEGFRHLLAKPSE